MAKLSNSARLYCEIHGIPSDRLFDADGLTKATYRELMKDQEKWAAFGVTPCYQGHVLRNRAGTCLMCDPERVAHLLRSKMSGFLYVASGGGGRLMKLGFSGNPANRLKIANYEGWGGQHDWCLRAYGWSKEAGALEAELHAEFQHRQVCLQWDRNYVPQVTREAYLADITLAAEKLVWLCDSIVEVVPPPWH